MLWVSDEILFTLGAIVNYIHGLDTRWDDNIIYNMYWWPSYKGEKLINNIEWSAIIVYGSLP